MVRGVGIQIVDLDIAGSNPVSHPFTTSQARLLCRLDRSALIIARFAGNTTIRTPGR